MIRRRATRLAALVLLAALFAGLAAAQEQPAEAPADGLVSLDFNDVELGDVIKTIAKMTGRNFIYDDRVRGRVTIVSPSPVPVEQAYAVFESVLQVIYLVFNEGYAASSGESLTRPDLSGEAIRLGRLLVELLPEPDVIGLLALMLLHESRRVARTTDTGELILLNEQDRSQWNRAQIDEGKALVERAFAAGAVGAYTLQAAIAAVHADAPSAEAVLAAIESAERALAPGGDRR